MDFSGQELIILVATVLLSVMLTAGWLGFRFRSQLMDLKYQQGISLERLAGKDRLIEGQAQEIAVYRKKHDENTAELLKLSSTHAELQARLQEERKNSLEKLSLLEVTQEKLAERFKALSSEALSNNNQSFLSLAKESFSNIHNHAQGDLEKRQQAIDMLLKPMQESLERVGQRLGDIEKARVGAYEGLSQQVKGLFEVQQELRTETSMLARALRTPHVRGRWGEIQLKRVVEMAGMLGHCDFFEQESAETEQGRQRPDLLVRLPGNKTIVVDSKAALGAYLEAMETDDENLRLEKIRDHARHIRNHMTQLSRKSYWEQFQPAPEFVVLFLPGEMFFSAALEQDPSLIEAGVEQRVIIATPTTLIALLRAVAYGWQQENLASNARAISQLGKELYKRIADLGGHFNRLGKNLGMAVDSYNRAVGTLESRVLVSARKFKELESSPAGLEIEELVPAEQSPRILQPGEETGNLLLELESIHVPQSENNSSDLST